MLARMPHITVQRNVRDAAGRLGIAVTDTARPAIAPPGRPFRRTLIFDPVTGDLLATVQTDATGTARPTTRHRQASNPPRSHTPSTWPASTPRTCAHRNPTASDDLLLASDDTTLLRAPSTRYSPASRDPRARDRRLVARHARPRRAFLRRAAPADSSPGAAGRPATGRDADHDAATGSRR